MGCALRQILLIFTLFLFLPTCGRINYEDILRDRSIESFYFSSAANPALGLDINAILPKHAENSYLAVFPKDMLPQASPGLDLVASYTINGYALFVDDKRQISGESALNFSDTQSYEYKLYSYDGNSTNYTIKVKNAEAWFTSFSFKEEKNSALKTTMFGNGSIIIDESAIEANAIWFDLPHKISLKGLRCSFTTEPAGVKVCYVDSNKKEIDQTSVQDAQDYSDYCVYRVFDNRNETYLDYKVSAYRLTYLSFEGYEDSLSADGAHLEDGTIRVELAYGTNLSALKPVFRYNGDTITFNGKTIVSGGSEIDFSTSAVAPVTVDVATRGGKTKRYKLIVSTTSGPGVAPVNPPNDPVLPDGSQTESGEAIPGVITTAAQLAAISDDLGGEYFLGADIDLGGVEWDPIGPVFTGSLDGNNHTISDYKTTGSDKGLFGTNNGTIRNIVLKDVDIFSNTTDPYVNNGALASVNTNIIENCSVQSGSVDAGNSSTVGGLVAYNKGGTIRYCFSTINVSGATNTGGLVGCSGYGALIEYCYYSGTVTSKGSGVGGLVGSCYNDGTTSSVSFCYSSGSVISTAVNAEFGGLIGVSYNVENSYSTSMVSAAGGNFVGGFVGNSKGDISNCYATGSISGSTNVGGLVGYRTAGTVSNSFFLDDHTNGNGTKISAPVMKSMATFTNAGWDFAGELANGSADYWAISPSINGGYPYLR